MNAKTIETPQDALEQARGCYGRKNYYDGAMTPLMTPRWRQPRDGAKTITLEGDFTADDLRAFLVLEGV